MKRKLSLYDSIPHNELFMGLLSGIVIIGLPLLIGALLTGDWMVVPRGLSFDYLSHEPPHQCSPFVYTAALSLWRSLVGS
jgi:hypothetical protein